MAFCPKCGKEIGEEQVFCKDCARQINPIIKEPKNIAHFLVCKMCGLIMHKNKWVERKNMMDSIQHEIEKVVKPKQGAEIKILTTKKEISKKLDEQEKVLDIQTEVTYENRKEKHVFKVKPLYRFCDVCLKRKTNYFQGILQLRNVNQKMVDFVSKHFEKSKNPDEFIAKIEEIHDGVDVFISYKKYIYPIAKSLRKKFGGEIKTSKKLMTQKEGKRIYRVYVLFKGLNAGLDDVISVEGFKEPFKVMQRGDEAILRNLKTGKNKYMDLSKVNYQVLSNIKAKIIQLYPKPKILNPETYQPIELIKPDKRKIEENQEIETVILEDKAYLV